MPIPKHLKEQKIWTLSSPDKIPLDVYELYQNGIYKPLQIASIGQCYDYYTTKKIQLKHPETYMTIHSDTETTFTLVDIEKEGVTEYNPFLYLDFIYFERSKSNGRHGMLLYQIDELQDILKDGDTDTEFFKNNHFMIITEDELELPETKYTLFDFIDKLTSKNEKSTRELDGQEFETVTLSNIDKIKLRLINIQSYQHFDPDESANEFKYVRYITKTVLRHFGQLDEDTLLNYVIYLTNLYMPYREKHYKYANFAKYGYISKRLYMILNAVFSIIEE